MIDTFCALLQEKLSYGPQERDMCLMHHEIQSELPCGKRQMHSSTLLAYGTPEESSMAKTVGLTASVGVELLLTGQVERTGVHIPTTPDIYVPGLQILEREGLSFTEHVRDL